jgi:hypothetical protein
VWTWQEERPTGRDKCSAPTQSVENSGKKERPRFFGPLLWDFDKRYLMVMETPVEVDAE